MNFKTTIALAVLLAVGGSVLFFTRDSGKADGDSDVGSIADRFGGNTTPAEYVFDKDLNEDDLVRLVLERGDLRLVFERDKKEAAAARAADWRMIEPVAAPTESWKVGNLARTLAKVQYRQSFEPGKDGGPSGEAAGFAPATAVVTLTDADGKEYKLEVGKKAAMSDDSFVRIAGAATIYRANRDLVRFPSTCRTAPS